MENQPEVPEQPHSDEAERALLGAILVNNEHFGPIKKLITSAEFYRPSHRAIFETMERLAARGIPLDAITVTNALRDEEKKTRVVDLSVVSALMDGVYRSANAEHYARIVTAKARRRRLIEHADRLKAVAADDISEEDVVAAHVRDLVEIGAMESRSDALFTPATLEGVLSESAGQVEWLVEGLLPKGELTLMAAAWKTAKSLCGYGLAVDAVLGRPVFGTFKVDRPLRVLCIQLEMPHREDLRRLRRLARGAGIEPADLVRLAKEGALTFFSRPPLDLASREGVWIFHELVERYRPDLVIVDSAIAAFSSAELNSNPEVRRILTLAFAPLTTRGISVLLLHHYRKSNNHSKEDTRGSVLGAQAFAATAGRVYGLERLVEKEGTRNGTGFQVKLSLLGSWSPEESEDHILAIEDTPDGAGTVVRVLDGQAEFEGGGLTKKQHAAMGIVKLVSRRGRVAQKDALVIILCEYDVGEKTARDALGYAVAQNWVRQEDSPGAKHNEKDLVPGSSEP